MQDLNLNQRQVCGLIGRSKASVSQYLSGKQVPSEEVQEKIAVALGLESNYFRKLDDKVNALPARELRDGVIPQLDAREAAKLMGLSCDTIRKGLRQQVFPWGYAIRTSETRWRYFINKRSFEEIERITI